MSELLLPDDAPEADCHKIAFVRRSPTRNFVPPPCSAHALVVLVSSQDS